MAAAGYDGQKILVRAGATLTLTIDGNVSGDVTAGGENLTATDGAYQISTVEDLQAFANYVSGGGLKIFNGDIYGTGSISFKLTAENLTNAEFKLNSVKIGETEITASGGTYSVELGTDGGLKAESFIQISGAYCNEIQNVSVAGTAATPTRFRLTWRMLRRSALRISRRAMRFS